LIGTAFNFTLICFYAWNILPSWLTYFWERKIASLIWTVLFLLHGSGVLTKIIIGIWFRNVEATDNKHQLRQKLITFFRTNVFYYNFRVGTFTLIVYFITILYGVVEHFDQTSSFVSTALFYWCVAFIIRIVVSVTRFNKLFRDDPYHDNKTDLFDLPEFEVTTKQIEEHPRLKNDLECLVCKIEFELGEKFIEFPCDGRHCFHKDCIESWMKIKQNCPACSKFLYDISDYGITLEFG